MNHKQVPKLGVVMVLAMAAILLCAIPASARAVRLEFEGTTCIQYQDPPERFWFSDDGVMHSRGAILHNIDITDGNFDTGTNVLFGNLDLNPATGYGHAYGTFTISPTAYTGTFVGSWSSHISPDGLRGSAVGHGTGDLEGLQIVNNMTSDNPNDPCTNSKISILIP